MGRASRVKREMRTVLRRLKHQRHKEDRSAVGAHQDGRPSPQVGHAPSRWHEAPADKRANIEALDKFAGLRNALRDIAAVRDDWSGIPMPLDGERLVVEPTWPTAKEFMAMGKKAEPEIDEFPGAKIRNSFWSWSRRSDIDIWEHGGKIHWGLHPGVHHFAQDLRTLGCSDAWGIEQESAAVATLAGLVSHRAFTRYMLTGMFLETSKRSGITYMFRRLKPTVALTPHKGADIRILCALCLHPIAYYSGSWAGAMCPTDDVIAHLMLMRGDEPMFWRRANQHPAWRPEAGL